MTTTWIDIPGSKLRDRYDAIDFSLSRAATALSVSFGGDVPEERAFRDGAFPYPYHQSVHDGNVYALRRADGWPLRLDQAGKPKPLRVYVDEQAPTISTFWTLLHEVDFTQAANATLITTLQGTNGNGFETTWSYGGKLWNVRARSYNGGTPAGAFVVNGQGVRLQCSDSSWGGSSAPQHGAALHLNFATQLPGWDASKPTALLAQLYTPGALVLQEGFGVSSWTWGSHVTTHLSGGWYAPASSGAPLLRRSDRPQVQVSASPVFTVDEVLGVMRMGSNKGCGAYGSYAGAFPVIEDMVPFADLTSPGNAAAAANGGGVYVTGGFGHVMEAYVRRLQVWQRL